MDLRLPCYLRTVRRRWGFSQQEIAFLLDLTHGSHISRVERLNCPPNARVLLALDMIFDAPPAMLFPAFHGEVKEDVIRRAYELLTRLEASGREADARKIELLRELPRRDATIRFIY